MKPNSHFSHCFPECALIEYKDFGVASLPFKKNYSICVLFIYRKLMHKLLKNSMG